jgi:hypothetical protein
MAQQQAAIIVGQSFLCCFVVALYTQSDFQNNAGGSSPIYATSLMKYKFTIILLFEHGILQYKDFYISSGEGTKIES